MDWKEALKPTKLKIILTIILTIIVLFFSVFYLNFRYNFIYRRCYLVLIQLSPEILRACDKNIKIIGILRFILPAISPAIFYLIYSYFQYKRKQ